MGHSPPPPQARSQEREQQQYGSAPPSRERGMLLGVPGGGGGTRIAIDGKGGAIRSFAIPTEWEKTQIMVWSKDVGRKSFKTSIEVLQGPNNPKQHLNLRCGGSTQPYHAVIDTPPRLDDSLQFQKVFGGW